MTDSMQMLRSAHKLRDAGEIPEHIVFWAVENPLTNAADRVRQKVTIYDEHACVKCCL